MNLSSCYKPGNWFQLPRDFILILKYGETIFLSHMINIRSMKFQKEEEENEWFPYPAKLAEAHLNMPRRKQDRFIDTLKKMKILKTKIKGNPGKRWVKINERNLCKIIDKTKAVATKARESKMTKMTHVHESKMTHVSIEETINKNLSEPTEKVQTASDTSKRKQIHPRWMKFASELSNAIEKVKKINCQSKLKTWANAFRLLHEREHVTIKRIRTVLKWYCKIYPEQIPYTPVAESGRAFREKFLKIESAMNRMGKKQENQSEKDPRKAFAEKYADEPPIERGDASFDGLDDDDTRYEDIGDDEDCW